MTAAPEGGYVDAERETYLDAAKALQVRPIREKARVGGKHQKVRQSATNRALEDE